MKKIYILIAAACMGTQAMNAQFTMLRAYHEPTVTPGMNVADMVSYDSIGVLPNTPGQGQTWNFSAMNINTLNINTQTYVAVDSGTLDALFTGATLKADKGGGEFDYFKSDSANGQFLLVGEVVGSSNFIYSDPKLVYKWPINSTSSYNDAYIYSSGAQTGSGTSTVMTTGSGTLMLVGGKSFDGVMQITSHDQEKIGLTGDTAMVHIIKYQYFWSQNRYPLLTVQYMTHILDGDTTKTADIWVHWLEAVGITDNNFESHYSIYPNPADNLVGIKLSNPQMQKASLLIQNINGQQVRAFDLGSSVEIAKSLDVSDLPKGIYIVKTRLGDRHGIRKLIIE